VAAADADGAEDGDLSRMLLDGDGHERRHQQESDHEADRAQHESELAEVPMRSSTWRRAEVIEMADTRGHARSIEDATRSGSMPGRTRAP